MTNHSGPDLTNKLALGTVQFGLDYGISNVHGKTSEAEIKNILRIAASHDIDLLDTAFSYGTSEEVLGKVLSHKSNFKFKIVSKFPKPEGKSIGSYLQQSMHLLNVTSVYGYLAHSAEVLLENPEVWQELTQLKAGGRIAKIGYSLYEPQQLEKLLKLNMVPDLVQLPYNVFDRRFEPAMVELKKHNIEIHTRSAFLQGLFFMKPDALPSFFNPVKPFLKEMQLQYSTLAELSGALLYFCMGNPMVDRVVIGVNTAEQLIQNIARVSAHHSVKDWKRFQITDEAMVLPYRWPERKQI